MLQFDYTENAQQQMLSQLDAMQHESDEICTAQTAFNQRRDEIHRRLQELRERQTQQQKAITLAEQKLTLFEKTCEHMRQYEALCADITSCEAACRTLLSDISDIEQKQIMLAGQIRCAWSA